MYVSRDAELSNIESVIAKIKNSGWDIHPSKTCLLCVSPDYTGIFAQLVSHGLTVDDEIYCIETVQVSFPDEDIQEYKEVFEANFAKWRNQWSNFLVLEAGVIKGNTFTWVAEVMKGTDFKTVALYQAKESKYQCDLVGHCYESSESELEFWWEKPNKHF